MGYGQSRLNVGLDAVLTRVPKHRKRNSHYIAKPYMTSHCRQPMTISAVSATLPGRIEKTTYLMTCEIRPRCASMAIFVLRANKTKNDQDIHQLLTCLSHSSLVGYPRVSFLPFPSAVIQPSEEILCKGKGLLPCQCRHLYLS